MNDPPSHTYRLTAVQMLQVVAQLDEVQPHTDTYERGTHFGPDESRTTWYRSQKEHLQGWLREYGGPGAYQRKNPGRDARFFYNHFKCVAGLMWLAEALGANPRQLTIAIDAVRSAAPNPSSQCGAFRRVIGWDQIAELASSSASVLRVAVPIDRRPTQSPTSLRRLGLDRSRLRPG